MIIVDDNDNLDNKIIIFKLINLSKECLKKSLRAKCDFSHTRV